MIRWASAPGLTLIQGSDGEIKASGDLTKDRPQPPYIGLHSASIPVRWLSPAPYIRRVRAEYDSHDIAARGAIALRRPDGCGVIETVEPSQQELPRCHRHPERLCSGDCQYILRADEGEWDAPAQAELPLT